MNSNKQTDIVDRAMGLAIKERRIELRTSQMALGEAIGVSFQQIQKYEKGSNRVSVSTAYKIATALHTTVHALLDNVNRQLGRSEDTGSCEEIIDLFNDNDIMSLALAFRKIPNRGPRRALLELTDAISKDLVVTDG